MSKIITRSNGYLEVRENDTEDVGFGYITTRDLDRYNSIIIPEGIDTKNYEKTGKPVLFNHNSDLLIANAMWLKLDKPVDPYGVIAKWSYVKTKESEDARFLIKKGRIKSLSIGIIPDERYIIRGAKGETIYNKSEMIEFSVCYVPVNPSCEILQEDKQILKSLKSDYMKNMLNEEIKEGEIDILKNDLEVLLKKETRNYELVESLENKFNQLNERIDQLIYLERRAKKQEEINKQIQIALKKIQ